MSSSPVNMFTSGWQIMWWILSSVAELAHFCYVIHRILNARHARRIANLQIQRYVTSCLKMAFLTLYSSSKDFSLLEDGEQKGYTISR